MSGEALVHGLEVDGDFAGGDDDALLEHLLEGATDDLLLDELAVGVLAGEDADEVGAGLLHDDLRGEADGEEAGGGDADGHG